jgi:hypothetical protein
MKITDDYIRGFVDGEGTFSVSILWNSSMKTGFQIVPYFSIGLSMKDENREILDIIKRRFGVGEIYVGDSYVHYTVESIVELNKCIIPFFERNTLIVKRRDFEIWREIVKHMSKGNHLTKHGLKTYIVPLIEELYNLRKEKRPRKVLEEMKKALGMT